MSVRGAWQRRPPLRHLACVLAGTVGTLLVQPCVRTLVAQTVTNTSRAGVRSGDTLRLTLADIELRVLRDNPALRIGRLDESLARGDVVTAGLKQNPQLNVNADILPTGSERYNPNNKQYGLQWQIPLERANKRGLRTSVAERTVDFTIARTRDAAREQLVAARYAWSDLQSAHAALRISESTVATYDRLIELSRSRFEARQIAEVEYSRVIVERGRALVERDARLLAVRQAETALATLVGLAGPIVPVDTLVPVVRGAVAYDSLVSIAMAQRPDIAAARWGTEIVAADQRLQEAVAHPDWALSFDYSMQQTIPLYGVSMQIPIPQYNRNQGERQKAAVRQTQAQLQLDAVTMIARADVRRAYDALESSRSTLARFENRGDDGILRRALSAKTSAEFAYRNGATSLLELLDSERTYNDIYRSYVDAVAQFNKSAAQLDEALGILPEQR